MRKVRFALIHGDYHKIPKYSDTLKNCCNYPKR